jgi:hypothetical protein
MSGSGSKVLKSTEMTGSISKILQTPYQGDVPARKCSSNHAVEAVKCCNNRGEEDCNHMEGSSSKTADKTTCTNQCTNQALEMLQSSYIPIMKGGRSKILQYPTDERL